jgi:hypothetical protein
MTQQNFEYLRRINEDSILRTTEILARAVGDDVQIGVKFRPGEAHYNEKERCITFPIIPFHDRHLEIYILSIIYRAGFRARFVDYDMDAPDEKTRAIWKTLEHLWIERLGLRLFPGSRAILDTSISQLVIDGEIYPSSIEDNAIEVLKGYIMHTQRVRLFEQTGLNSISAMTRAAALARFGQTKLSQLDTLLKELDEVANSIEAIMLAGEIVALFEDELNERPTQDQSSSSQGAPQNEASSNEVTPTGNEVAEEDASQDSSDESSGGSNKGQASEESGSNTPRDRSSGSDSISEMTLNAIMERAMDQNEAQSYISMANLDKTDYRVLDTRVFEDDVETSTEYLQRTFDILLQSQRKTRRVYSESGYKLDTNRLAGITAGNTNVLYAVKRKKAMDTAVTILADMSTSMSAPKGPANQLVLKRYQIARNSMYALANTLDRVRHVDYNMAYFYGDDTVTQVTDFHEDAKSTAHRYLHIRPQGLTPMAEAIYWAYAKLASSRRSRKVVLVLTDGKPQSNQYRGNYTAITREIIQRGIQAGVEIYGLGIETMSVVDLFPHYSVIEHRDGLPQALFELSQQILIPQAA